MTRILPMVCGSFIVNNKIIEISKLIEERGLFRPPCRRPTFACYLHLVDATGLTLVSCSNSAALDVLGWSSSVAAPVRAVESQGRHQDYRAKAGFWVTQQNF